MGKAAVSYDFDLKNLKRLEPMMRAINRHGGKIEVPLKRWGVYEVRQTDITFRKEGRGHIRWPKLSKMTLAMREWSGRGKGSKKPLQVSGHLRRSIDTITIKSRKGAAQKVFSKVPYGYIHQHGGTIKTPARTIVPKNKKALAFFPKGGRSGGSMMVVVKKVHQPARTAKVPKRPFLFITREDQKKAMELIELHARDSIRKAGFK